MIFAEGLKAALESSCGIKGCRVSVVEVNGLQETGVVKWEGISSYSSFRYEEKGIRAWRAFVVGEGRLFALKILLRRNKEKRVCELFNLSFARPL